ncbi:MAG: aminotransferase class IV family protein [Thermotogaceae bacterium]|nr:aminotransferase class IV family protein [Thermotogaceae bacterium]
MKLIIKEGKECEENCLKFSPYEPVVYETLRTYNKKPHSLEEHFRRLLKSSSFVDIKVKITEEDIENFVKDFCKDKESECYFKIYIDSSNSFYIEATLLEDSTPQPAKIGFSPYRKAPDSSIPSQLKIITRSDILLTRINKGDNYDLLMLNSKGFVAEGSFSNVFFVKDGVLITPPLDCDVLDGITRWNVMEVAKNSGIKVIEKRIQPWEVFLFDEIFLTHTSKGIVPVRTVVNKNFEAPGKITGYLIDSFKSFVRKS